MLPKPYEAVEKVSLNGHILLPNGLVQHQQLVSRASSHVDKKLARFHFLTRILDNTKRLYPDRPGIHSRISCPAPSGLADFFTSLLGALLQTKEHHHAHHAQDRQW